MIPLIESHFTTHPLNVSSAHIHNPKNNTNCLQHLLHLFVFNVNLSLTVVYLTRRVIPLPFPPPPA